MIQDLFGTYAADIQRIKLEMMCRLYTDQNIAKQANVMAMNDADKELLQPALQMMRTADIVWRVTVRSESLSATDYAQLQSERVSFLEALSMFLQSSGKLIETTPEALPSLLEMLKWGLAGFRGAREIEGVIDKAILAMHVRQGMTYEEADEYFEYNTIGGWYGEQTPMFLNDLIDLGGTLVEEENTTEMT
jgi:hypothetical protein